MTEVNNLQALDSDAPAVVLAPKKQRNIVWRRALWEKEAYQLFSPLAIFALMGIWLVWGISFFVFYLQYQEIAPKLALLENRRGATQMLLVSGENLLLWLVLAWGIFFASRSVALEFELHSFRLIPRNLGGFRAVLACKFFLIFTAGLLLFLPFWLGVIIFSWATDWDKGQLFGMACGQILLWGYFAATWILAAGVLRQGISTALLSALLCLLLYFLPTIIYEPAWLAALGQWFSPFVHFDFLSSGIFHVQTLLFMLLHAAFFYSLFLLLDWEAR